MPQVLELTNKVPIRHVLHAVHSDAVDVKIPCPTRQIGKHQLPSWNDRFYLAGDRVIGEYKLRIPEQRTPITVS